MPQAARSNHALFICGTILLNSLCFRNSVSQVMYIIKFKWILGVTFLVKFLFCKRFYLVEDYSVEIIL